MLHEALTFCLGTIFKLFSFGLKRLAACHSAFVVGLAECK